MIRGLRLLLVTDAVGGVWVYSLELARALGVMGAEPLLVVMGPSPSAAQMQDASGLKLIDTNLPLDWLDTDPDELRRGGAAIAAIAEREQADLVQTCSAALLADNDFAQPCVAVQHSCVASWWAAVRGTPLPPEFAWRQELVQRGLAKAAAIVAPTRAFADETGRLYRRTVVAVHNGRRSAPARALPQGEFIFTASRLWDEGKNVATLDDAAAQLGLPFQAAGGMDGPNGAKIALRNIHALGEISPARLAGVLAACPIFASAALYEPFGLSVLEAAQAGCALVLSDIATHRELWDGAATFVPARDSAAFAIAIQALSDQPDRRQRMGEAARERAKLYTPERMAQGMAEVYTGVLEKDVSARALSAA